MTKASTHPIGTGTHNLSINVPLDEWEAFKRLAEEKREGLGALLRRVLLSGAEAEDARTASQIREARRFYYGSALLALGLWVVAQEFRPTDSGFEMRRTSARVRVVRPNRSGRGERNETPIV